MSGPVLDETALRRATFADGPKVTLADGQAWTLNPPPVRGFFSFAPAGDGGGLKVVKGNTAGEAEYDGLLDGYLNAETGLEEAVALAGLAWAMLTRNYDLPASAMRALLRVYEEGHPDKGANQEAWSAVADAALGVTPKPTAVG